MVVLLWRGLRRCGGGTGRLGGRIDEGGGGGKGELRSGKLAELGLKPLLRTQLVNGREEEEAKNEQLL